MREEWKRDHDVWGVEETSSQEEDEGGDGGLKKLEHVIFFHK